MRPKLGNLVIIVLVFLTGVIWLFSPPVNDGRPTYARAYAAELVGSVVIVLMSTSLFLSTRPKWAESYFGGLDKMYQTHRRAAVSAFLLLFVHLLVTPITVVNLHLGNYLAIVAFSGIVTLVLVTLSPRIPILSKLTNGSYDGWKKVHRYMGIFFILGYLHSINVNAPSDFIAINWTQIFVITGILSYTYTELLGGFFKKKLPYVVEAVRHLNGNTTEVTLKPKNTKLNHKWAGQFLFVHFPGDKVLNESHPFTISSGPREPHIRLTVKASGDFTRYLFHNLKAGMEAVVDGAYGLFDYQRGGEKQIWIAGGIGITPFLSFMRGAETLSHEIHFYYTVRTREESLFLDEIEATAARHASFHPHVRFSIEGGSLRMDDILADVGGDVSGYHVYMCGPLGMVQAFAEQFRNKGVAPENIHYEEFNFR
jgi:predicted ferric reductase